MPGTKFAERERFALARALVEGRPILIGRALDAHVRLEDERVSKLHCRVELRKGRVLVTDLASTNGTFVAGQRIEQAELCPGDSFLVGEVQFLVVEAGSGLAIEPLPDPRSPRATGGEARSGPRAAGVNAETAPVEPIPGYRVIERLSQSVAGRAYLTEHAATGSRRLLKLMPFPDTVKEAVLFIREAEVGSKLKHPNVLETLEFGELAGVLYLALENVLGPSLEDRVGLAGPISPAEALDHLRALSDVLRLASERRLVLRSIRPANILIPRPGLLKLAPFGGAKGLADRSAVTNTGDLRSVSPYAAPEVFADPVRADTRSDIFALGATYYFALAGIPPFIGKSLPELRRSVLTAEPPALEEMNPGVPAPLALTIRRMMRKDPDQRFQSPDELLDALLRLAA